MMDKNESPILANALNRNFPLEFTDEAVDAADLEQIMQAAMLAPSAFEEQPWRFFVATEPEDRAALIEYMTPGSALRAQIAPVLIAIAGNIYGTKDHTFNYWSGFDSGAAWSYMALEAARLGYGVSFITGFDRHDIKREFALEDEDFYDFYGIIALGHVKEDSSQPKSERMPLEKVSLVRRIKKSL